MQLNELKLVTASNIIRLRQSAGLTQAELGAKLSYSDKSISKWERGEAIPDAYTLTVIAEIFGVTVDYLLSSHDQWEGAKKDEGEEHSEESVQYSASLIITLVFVSVWTAAISAFVVLWLVDIVCWQIFVFALPLSLLVLIILERVFFKHRNLQFFIAAFVLSLLLMLFFLFFQRKPWQLFLVALPALAVIFIACNLQKKPMKWRKSRTKD